jgi:hypothetical protein
MFLLWGVFSFCFFFNHDWLNSLSTFNSQCFTGHGTLENHQDLYFISLHLVKLHGWVFHWFFISCSWFICDVKIKQYQPKLMKITLDLIYDTSKTLSNTR